MAPDGVGQYGAHDCSGGAAGLTCCPELRNADFESAAYTGGVPKRPNGADCKSAGLCLRWFESNRPHSTHRVAVFVRGTGVVGRVEPEGGGPKTGVVGGITVRSILHPHVRAPAITSREPASSSSTDARSRARWTIHCSSDLEPEYGMPGMANCRALPFCLFRSDHRLAFPGRLSIWDRGVWERWVRPR